MSAAVSKEPGAEALVLHSADEGRQRHAIRPIVPLGAAKLTVDGLASRRRAD